MGRRFQLKSVRVCGSWQAWTAAKMFARGVVNVPRFRQAPKMP